MKQTKSLGLFISLISTLGIYNPSTVSAYELRMIPPDELTINGQDIVSGTFSITNGIGYFTNDGTTVQTENLGSTSHSNAQIGNPTPFTLFPNIPDNVEVLRLVGDFTADNPVLNPPSANFDIIVGAFDREVVDFTY